MGGRASSHEHSYGDWSKDGTSHWHECTDDDCPKKPESIKDKAAHVYTDDADTTCNVCGYERTVTPPAPTEFIVTFDAGDGTPSVGSMTTTNQKLSSLPSASRSKHSFNGWYTEKNGGTKVTTDTVFSANTNVYAHWTYTGGYYSPVYYTLTFETNGGDKLSPVSGSYNALIDLSKYAPKRSGYAFTGWYSERSLTNKVSGVYLTKDMTVYAGWRVTTAPQTDDSSVLGLWGISLCTSLAGCLALTTWQIRRRREENRCKASKSKQAHLQARGQIAPRPFSASFVRKGGCSFEQPPFAISIRFEQKGNQSMTKSTGGAADAACRRTNRITGSIRNESNFLHPPALSFHCAY